MDVELGIHVSSWDTDFAKYGARLEQRSSIRRRHSKPLARSCLKLSGMLLPNRVEASSIGESKTWLKLGYLSMFNFTESIATS